MVARPKEEKLLLQFRQESYVKARKPCKYQRKNQVREPGNRSEAAQLPIIDAPKVMERLPKMGIFQEIKRSPKW